MKYQLVYENIINRDDWPVFVRCCTERCNQIDIYHSYLFPTVTQVNEFIGRCAVKWSVAHVDKLQEEYDKGNPTKPEYIN